MSKSDQKAAKQQAQSQITQNNANTAAVNETLQDVLGTAKSTASSVLPTITSGYSDIAAGKGYDPSILGAAKDTFTGLATTGGISAADATAMRNRAGEAATSAYSTGSDAARRAITSTGGYGTSGAILGNLARKGSQAAAQATEDTNASIAGLRQGGMIAGGQGLVSTAAGADAATRTQLAGLGGLTNVYGLNESQVNATVDAILQNYKTNGELNNQDLTILTNLANQPGVFDKIVGTIGTLGGAAAGVMTGIGALGGKK